MINHVIRQTKNRIGIVPASRFNQYQYENELKIIRLLLCECSHDYMELLKDCDSEELPRYLSDELKQDKQTIYMN